MKQIWDQYEIDKSADALIGVIRSKPVEV